MEKEIVELRGKTYSYLIDGGSDGKIAKKAQKACHKKKT